MAAIAAIIASFAVVTLMLLNGIAANISITEATIIATDITSILVIISISILARELAETTNI